MECQLSGLYFSLLTSYILPLRWTYLISGTERYGTVPFRKIKVPKLRNGTIPGNLST